MGLQTLAQTDIAKFLSRHGEAITYTPSGGAGSAINGTYQTRQLFDDMGSYLGAELELVVANADVASPAEGDSVVIGSGTWTVRTVQDGTHYHKLICTKDERVGH